MRGRRESSARDEQLLEIEVNMAALQDIQGASEGGVSFSLLDTPGPNESGELLKILP